MSDERRGNVVRGGFGKRRTDREPDRRNPQPKVLNSNWLDPDAYNALSPQEKRDLWAKRKIERKYNRRRKNHGGRRDNPIASTLLGLGIFGVLVAGALAWQSRPMSLFSSSSLTASGQAAGPIASWTATRSGWRARTFALPALMRRKRMTSTARRRKPSAIERCNGSNSW